MLRPGFFQAGLWLGGNALWKVGQYQEALRAYERAISLAAKLASPWNGKGHVYWDLGQYEAALEAFERGISIDPSLANIWNGKGNTL